MSYLDENQSDDDGNRRLERRENDDEDHDKPSPEIDGNGLIKRSAQLSVFLESRKNSKERDQKNTVTWKETSVEKV